MYDTLQKKTLAGCVIAYTAAYIGRMNLSAVLPSLTQRLSLGGAESGLFQTVFALCYAAGQVINGTVSDRVNPRRHIVSGLILSAVLNCLMGVLNDYFALLTVWALNGFAQSMLWTPMVRLLALKFTDRARTRAAYLLSYTFVVGHFLSWLLAGVMNQFFSFEAAFIAPGVLMAVCAGVVLCLLPSVKGKVLKDGKKARGSSLGALFATGFVWLLLLGAAEGFVRDGVMTWAPSLLFAAGQGGALSMLLIPLLNILGLWLGNLAYRATKGGGRVLCMRVFLCAAAVCLLLLCFGLISPLNALLMGAACALMYSITPILTTVFPLEYDKIGLVGLAAGLIDCSIYLGSALSGVAGGALKAAGGGVLLYAGWAAVSLLGVFLCRLSIARKKEV